MLARPPFSRQFTIPRSSAVWTPEALRMLRQLADAGTPLETIAAQLQRSPSAIRNKAGLHGISLKRRTGSAASREPVLRV
jgi:hypothetical protein